MRQSHVVRVCDLPDQPSWGVMLHCNRCGENYSAYCGDYFAADPATILKCCGRPMRLVRKRIVYEEVR